MARKRRTRRRRRRRRRYARRPMISRAPLFGKFKAVKLRYCTAGRLVPDGTGTLFPCAAIRANAPGAPNPDNNSVTSKGWTNVAPLYEKCYCLGSKISVSFMPGAASHSAIFFVQKSNESLASLPAPPLEQILSTRYVRSKLYGSGRGSASHLKITYPFSAKKWFSVKDVKDNIQLSSPPFPGSTDNRPDRIAYFNFGYNVTHATSAGGIDYVAVIDYLCLFTEPVDVT